MTATLYQDTIGGDFAVGKFSAANYYLQTTKFSDGGFTPSSGLNFVPLNSETHVKSDTTTNTFKYRATISDRLYFTGDAIHTDRQDSTSVPNPSGLAGKSRDHIDQPGAHLSAHRRADIYWAILLVQSRQRCPFDSQFGGSIQNNTSSDSKRQIELNGSYTGIRHMFWSSGFENHWENQTSSTGGPGVFPFLNGNITTNYWRVGLRYYPLTALSIVANGSWFYGNLAAYAGTPNQGYNYSVNATYMLSEKLAIYGDYNLQDQNNTQNRVNVADVPTPATNAAQQVIRELAAGQGYAGLMSTTTLGTWYSLTPKLTLDLTYSKIIMDAQESGSWDSARAWRS